MFFLIRNKFPILDLQSLKFLKEIKQTVSVAKRQNLLVRTIFPILDIYIDFFNFRYEKYSLEGETRYSIAGFATVYQYYAYPANIRPRVSQVSCFNKRQEYFSH